MNLLAEELVAVRAGKAKQSYASFDRVFIRRKPNDLLVVSLCAHHLLRIANYSDTSAGWSGTATVADIGSPRPNAGEGLGGEGDTSLLSQFPKLSSGSRSRSTCDSDQGYVGPLTPDPSPALGRGELNSINFEGRSPLSLYSVNINNPTACRNPEGRDVLHT